MKLPQTYGEFKIWLLCKLPMWDYFCPACHTSLDERDRQLKTCSNCGLQIELSLEKLRSPPKILKDKKLLEQYVHKHIMPTLSKTEYGWLAQWFTVIFSNGFEEGNLTAWSGTTLSGGCAIAAQGVTVHTGSWAAQSDLAAWTNNALVYKTFGAETTVYLRAYLNIGVFMNIDGRNIQYILIQTAGQDILTSVIIANVGGTMKWGIYYFKNAGYTTTTIDTDNPIVDHWYCSEVMVTVDGVAGETEFWLDGVSKISDNTYDNDDNGDAERISVGQRSINGPGVTTTAYIDDVVVADVGPIGPMGGAVTVKSGSSVAATMMKMVGII